MKSLILAVVSCFVLAGGIWADEGRKIAIGVDYGIFYPNSSTAKSDFGKQWPRISFGQIDLERTEKWRFVGDFSSLSKSGNGRVRLYTFTWGAAKGLKNRKSPYQPYLAVRTGPYYGEVETISPAFSKTGMGWNANASVGVVFNKMFYVEGRYDYFSRMGGYNLDGFTVSGGVRLFDIRL